MDIEYLDDARPEDWPREKLLRSGAHSLMAAELLAVVLGTGMSGGEDVLQLACRVLTEVGGLDGLATATVAELRAVRGIGPVKAARVRAAFELAWRTSGAGADDTPRPPEPTESVESVVRRLRGQISPSERAVIGYRPGHDLPPITLALGEVLGPRSRLGSYLARLLAEGVGPWWVVVLRPSNGEIRDIERLRAADLLEAAHLVGVDLDYVMLLSGRAHHILAKRAS